MWVFEQKKNNHDGEKKRDADGGKVLLIKRKCEDLLLLTKGNGK